MLGTPTDFATPSSGIFAAVTRHPVTDVRPRIALLEAGAGLESPLADWHPADRRGFAAVGGLGQNLDWSAL